MFDHILSSEQISFFNGCVSQWKAELQDRICFSTTSHTPLVTLRDISPFLVLKVAWTVYSEACSEPECHIYMPSLHVFLGLSFPNKLTNVYLHWQHRINLLT